jgi:hypothetical protein
MLKKSLAFGLLVATLTVAPSSVFAQTQVQTSDQFTEQNGAAVNRSINVQTSVTQNRQVQNSVNGVSTGRYRCPSSKDKQAQGNRQTGIQSSVAENSSISVQTAGTVSNQVQSIRTRAMCY